MDGVEAGGPVTVSKPVVEEVLDGEVGLVNDVSGGSPPVVGPVGTVPGKARGGFRRGSWP